MGLYPGFVAAVGQSTVLPLPKVQLGHLDARYPSGWQSELERIKSGKLKNVSEATSNFNTGITA